MRFPRLSACLLLLAAPAAAQDARSFEAGDEDWRQLETCLRERQSEGVSGTQCIGAISDPCMDDPDNQSTPAMNGCLSKEADMWDHYLNQWYGVVTTALADEPQALQALKTAQRAWIAMRDATCDFEMSLWGGGTGGTTAANACFLRETGQRAVFLSGVAEFVQQ